MRKVMMEKETYGGKDAKREKVMVEYCQVNTHKAFHVGHLRGTFLGSSIIKIYRFLGFPVISANYQGDIGTHVAKVIWYLITKKLEFPDENKGIWLGKIYQKASSLMDDETKEEVSQVLQKIENNDPELTKIWKETRKFSLDDFEKFYELIGIQFDKYFFESQYEKKGKDIVAHMLKKGLAEKSDGAIIIDLEKDDLRKLLLLKSDGTALYSTKDLALAKDKFEKFDIDKSVYVVGAEQKFYFQQIFKTLEKLGFSQAKNCQHISYGLVNLKGGKISSREGELVYAEELINQLIESAKKEIIARHKDIGADELNGRAKKIGLAAIKFSFINQDNNKEIIFDKEKSLSFEGETGPYVQYVHARICGIKKKYSQEVLADISFELLKTPEEIELVKTLNQFPTTIQDAAKHYKPSTVAHYLIELSQRFNEFYHRRKVIDPEHEELTKARLLLCECVRQVIANGLDLLGIDVLDEM